MSNDAPQTKEDETALKQYDAFLRYLAYENTVYWTRSQFFLVAQAALFGFFVNTITRNSTQIPDPGLLMLQASICAIGFSITYLWHRAISAGEFWIGHWHDIIKELEPKALGPIHAFRDFESTRKFVPARQITKRSMQVFGLAWLVAAAMLLLPLLRKWLCEV